MREPRKILCIVIMLPLILGACASLTSKNETHVTIQSLRAEPNAFTHKIVIVSGLLDVNALGNAILFVDRAHANRKDFDASVDIVQKVKRINFPAGRSCATITGKFVPYEKGSVQLDFLRSKIGLIEADSYSAEACASQ